MITLTQPTIPIVSGFNRVLYNIVSTNAANDGFKYVVKVYNGADEVITTLYLDTPPNPSSPVEFDVSKLITTDYDFTNGFNPATTVSYSTGILSKFRLRCYEYYLIDGIGVIVLDTEVVSTFKTALASAFPLLNLRDWNYDYLNRTFVNNFKPLTDYNVIKMRMNDMQVFSFYKYEINPDYIVAEYFINGEDYDSYTINIPFNGSYNEILHIGFRPSDYAPDDVTSIKLTIFVDGSQYQFATIYINECGKYEPVRLAYLNKYGAYDFMNFDLVSRTSFDTEKRSYQREYNGDVFVGDVVKNLNPNYYVKELEKMHLVSDYLTNEQSILLREMYSSPLVYLKRNNIWIPVKISQGSYEVKTVVVDKVFNVEIDVEFQLSNIKQAV
jgi:hypothetical protein